MAARPDTGAGRSETTEEKIARLEAWREGQEAKGRETADLLRQMSSDLTELTADLHRRQGQEQERERQRVEEEKGRVHGRHQAHERNEWIRAALPNAVLSGIFLWGWTQIGKLLNAMIGGN